MKMPQMNKKYSLFYISDVERLDKFLISCDVVP